jgi:integrase
MRALPHSHHLIKRKGVWYYRRRVPKGVALRVDKPVIQYSLGTKDKGEAIKRREVEDLKWAARFEQAEMAPAGEGDEGRGSRRVSKPAVPEHRAQRLVRDYVERVDARSRKTFEQVGLQTEDERAERRAELGVELTAIQDLDDPQGGEIVGAVADRILKSEKLSTDDLGGDEARFINLVRRAVIELDRRGMARLNDEHGLTHFDEAFNPASASPVTIGELAVQAKAEKAEEATFSGLARKSVDKFEASLALIVELLGEDTPVSAIDYDACMKVRRTLARVPTNRTKTYRSLTVAQSIEQAEADGHQPLSAITQQAYLAALKDLLELAMRKGLIAQNPARNLKPLKRDNVAAGDKRAPFSLAQIKAFFDSDFYRGCAASHGAPYEAAGNDWRFWLPLLCLFLGMRPNEVCQLCKGDVVTTTSGIPFINVTASDLDADDKSQSSKTLKTASSRRKIPIHPELISLGFLKFVASREGSNAPLFSLKPDKYGNLARYPLKRFNETFLPEAIELGSRQSFYSFRHSFRDALRRSNAPPEILRAFGGWSDGTPVSDAYGDKYDPDHTYQHMQKVTYPGLDLSPLYCRN